ncbi:MAG: hypothetical protein ACKVHE_33790, partial [Planctomycetales bacterium]
STPPQHRGTPVAPTCMSPRNHAACFGNDCDAGASGQSVHFRSLLAQLRFNVDAAEMKGKLNASLVDTG